MLIVKTGGVVAADGAVMEMLLRDLAAVSPSVILVHGGGKAVTEISRRLGITSTFRDGVRYTSLEEMEVVDMVLAGRTNTELVRAAQRCGVPAIGLTGADGGLLTGELLSSREGGRTAKVSEVHSAVLHDVIRMGYMPIVASVGIGTDGEAVNINADEAAHAIARAMAADHKQETDLCFLSDTPGVLGEDGSTIPEIRTNEVELLVSQQVVRDGMAAKIRSCAEAVHAGVHRVIIGAYTGPGDLDRLLAGSGTVVLQGGTHE